MLQNVHTEVDFFLRSHLRWSRRDFRAPGIVLADELNTVEPQLAAICRNLIEDYKFTAPLPHLGSHSFWDNMQHLSLLDAIAAELTNAYRLPEGQCRLLDIGSKNFCYAFALVHFIESLFRVPASVTGIEVDSHRLCSGGYSRASRAAETVRHLRNSDYREGDILEAQFETQFDVITLFFPFVELASHLDWGVPKRFFDLQRLVDRLALLVRKPALLIVTHMDASEHARFRSALPRTWKTVSAKKVKNGLTSGKTIFVRMYEFDGSECIPETSGF